MKKIMAILLLVLLLASCKQEENVYCDQVCSNYKIEQQKLRIEEKEKERIYELEKLRIQNSAPIQKKDNEGNDSLKYLENSQKTRDTIEAAAIGYQLFKILAD